MAVTNDRYGYPPRRNTLSLDDDEGSLEDDVLSFDDDELTLE